MQADSVKASSGARMRALATDGFMRGTLSWFAADGWGSTQRRRGCTVPNCDAAAGTGRAGLFALERPLTLAHALEHHVEHGNEKHADHRGNQHAEHHRGA